MPCAEPKAGLWAVFPARRAATRWGTEQNLICDHLQPAVMEPDRQLLPGWGLRIWGQCCMLGSPRRAGRGGESFTDPPVPPTPNYT